MFFTAAIPMFLSRLLSFPSRFPGCLIFLAAAVVAVSGLVTRVVRVGSTAAATILVSHNGVRVGCELVMRERVAKRVSYIARCGSAAVRVSPGRSPAVLHTARRNVSNNFTGLPRNAVNIEALRTYGDYPMDNGTPIDMYYDQPFGAWIYCYIDLQLRLAPTLRFSHFYDPVHIRQSQTVGSSMVHVQFTSISTREEQRERARCFAQALDKVVLLFQSALRNPTRHILDRSRELLRVIKANQGKQI